MSGRKAAAWSAETLASFVPKRVFEVSPSITRSYFLGHHVSALSSMRKIMSNIGLVLECRDGRVPLTSANPLLEASLAGRDRIIVYTKADLCAPASARASIVRQQNLLADYHSHRGQSFITEPALPGETYGASGPSSAAAQGPGNTQVVFTDEANPKSVGRLLAVIKERSARHGATSLLGLRALVVGMPNAGKSTLLNALRRAGTQRAKAARTGAQPGVTRKLSTPVRILEPSSSAPSAAASSPLGSSGLSMGGEDEGVYLVDTPGVFIPHVGDVESMLKLALVGCVKDGLVPAETVAAYLLFQLNLRDPRLYADVVGPHLPRGPTNDPDEWLAAVARRTGKLRKGGEPAIDAAADWVIQQWRTGHLGRFQLDDASSLEALRAWDERLRAAEAEGVGSMNQARKRDKEARKARHAAKRAAAADSGAADGAASSVPGA